MVGARRERENLQTKVNMIQQQNKDLVSRGTPRLRFSTGWPTVSLASSRGSGLLTGPSMQDGGWLLASVAGRM